MSKSPPQNQLSKKSKKQVERFSNNCYNFLMLRKVIIIIAVLVSLGIVAAIFLQIFNESKQEFESTQQRAKQEIKRVEDNQQIDIQKIKELETIKAVLNYYYSDYGVYPPSLEALVPRYLPKLPKDPQTGEDFQYTLREGGAKYTLVAIMANGSPYTVNWPN